MCIGRSWLTDPDGGLSIDASSDIAGTFFVENAKESTDSQGRKIIPMQDFVDSYNIYTVFGIGGQYKLGSHNIVAIIFFTKERISETIAKRFLPFINLFKTFTSSLILSIKSPIRNH